jgi:hypothetical protein
MRHLRPICLVLGLALASTACVGELIVEELEDQPLDGMFLRASEEFDVPVELLKAIGYVETGWSMVEGEGDELRPAAFGVMALRGADLELGARLAGVDPDDARYDAESNLRAAAALLRQGADAAAIDRHDLAAWPEVVGRLSGIEDAEARSYYLAAGVYRTLADGAQAIAEDGSIIATLEPTKVRGLDLPEVAFKGTADYPSSIWRPSGNYNYRPSGTAGAESMIVIHTCEGSYAGCWGWLKNPAAQASAHYVVNTTGGEITQLVREAHRAWHVAADYQCSRNGDVACSRNGQSVNNFAIGIELAGYASQATFPSGQIEATAKLVCDMTRDHGIARDRYHIVAHGKLQPWNRTDPGPNFPWNHFLSRVDAYCGGGDDDGGGGTTALVVDSNNARNDTNKGYVAVSASWSASTSAAGYFGTGYWWASTQAVSDGAAFHFYLGAAAKRTIDAWWTVGDNRSDRTGFVAFDSTGAKVGSVTRNQRQSGKQWNTLGTWQFQKGWNKIVVSRWAPEGKVVIADAIRVR